MKLLSRVLSILMVLLGVLYFQGIAQSGNLSIKKVSKDSIGWFDDRFGEVKWTGIGMEENLAIDRRQTNELRARLQTIYGKPTKTIGDLIGSGNFLISQDIQFEYWFVINDTIPLVVLDVDGPFRRGLTVGGNIQYKDFMGKVKRALSDKLMEPKISELSAYMDYYFSAERNQWYKVTFKDGLYQTLEISRPSPSDMETK